MEQKVKELVIGLGADLCGLAHVDDFTEAPAGFHPRDIFGDCRSVLVLAKRMPRGTGRVNPRIVYNKANEMNIAEVDRLSFAAALALEELGALAVPLPADGPYDYWEEENLRGQGLISMRHAAVLAGLGRLGRNTLLINQKLGNMITLGVVLTDLDLKSDPLADELCLPNCRRCRESCPTGALGDVSADQKRCRPHTYGSNSRGFGVINCNSCRTVCPLSFGLLDRPGPH